MAHYPDYNNEGPELIVAVVLFIWLLVFLLVSGCSSHPLTPDEEYVRDYNRQATVQNWTLCKAAYKRGGAVWVTERAVSSRRSPSHLDMRQDLSNNRCRAVLGKYWIEAKRD